MQVPILNGNRFYVYEHLCEDSDRVFYVGKGSGSRAYVASKHHRNEHWQRVVSKHGGFKVRFVVADVDEELAFLAEIERIDVLRKRGASLCNQTDGGDGTAGWVKTQEWREKVGRARRGKSVPQEVRDKLSRAVIATGYTHSAEAKAKISLSHLGHKYNLGRKQSPEERLKRAVSLIGNKSRTGQKRSNAERLATSIAMTGRKQMVVTCPHCGKSGGNAMLRWHFDQCKARSTQ